MLIESEGARIAERHLVEGSVRWPRLPVELQDLIALSRGAQHRIARSAAHVGCERDAYTRVAQPRLIERARAQKQVRGRAEGRDRPACSERGDLAVGEMNAVAEHRTRPEESGAFVDLEIGLRTWKELRDQFDLVPVLVEMRLDVGFRELVRQRARSLQLRLARGDREARGDRVVEPAPPPPARDQRLAFVVAALRRVSERLGRVPVHHRLAGDHAGAASMRRREKRVDRLRMNRAIDHRRSRAATEQFVEKEVRDPRAMRGIAEFLLLDERVIVQPVEQLRAIGADDLRLRIVDMRIDESRHDEAARIFVDDCGLGRASEDVERLADPLDAPVLDEYRSIREINTRGGPRLRRIVGEGEDASADYARSSAQGGISFTRRAAMRSISVRAARVSVSESLARRLSKAARMSALCLPFTATMNGKPKRPR